MARVTYRGADVRVVLCAEGPVEPTAAIEAYLEQRPPSPKDPLHLMFGMRRTPPPLPAELPSGLTVGTFLPGRGLRSVPDLEYDRSSYQEICDTLLTGKFAPDVVIACATSADDSGTRSLGAIDGYLGLAMRSASVVVEEVDWLPRIPGAALVPTADMVVASRAHPSDEQPHFSAPYDDLDLAIARKVVDLIPPSPQLALGIGRVPEAIGHLLRDRGDIAIMTGVITDTVRRLHEDGALTTGPAHGMSVVGGSPLLEWASRSHHVELHSSTIIHDPRKLRDLRRFVAVLGAVTVDQYGNVNSERTARGWTSGLGGAPDFAAGGHTSPGGLSIIALPSEDGRGNSRLVDHLEEPTIGSELVDVVVTEKGVAHLTGLPPRDRGRELTRVF
ncbi:MAG: 4-hydroxybutyrate CoA-transferase [Massilia sp.]|nr:4-hydroxybutyrate CoA-transferase [Massilia sp.]